MSDPGLFYVILIAFFAVPTVGDLCGCRHTGIIDNNAALRHNI